MHNRGMLRSNTPAAQVTSNLVFAFASFAVNAASIVCSMSPSVKMSVSAASAWSCLSRALVSLVVAVLTEA